MPDPQVAVRQANISSPRSSAPRLVRLVCPIRLTRAIFRCIIRTHRSAARENLVCQLRASFYARDGGELATAEVVAATEHAMDSPPMPPGVREWVEAEERIQSDVQRRIYEQVG